MPRPFMNPGGFFTRSVTLMAFITGLLLVDRIPAYTSKRPAFHQVDKVIDDMHNGDLSAEDLHALVAGYYEGLRNDVPLGIIEKDDVRATNGFLRYQLRPNVKRPYPAGMRVTNSLGMPNPEYGYEKPPHTLRIALLGDSVAIGPYGRDYPALLEKRLNQCCLSPAVQKFEILNFAVYGYSVVQMMDVACERAPKFHPDVYLVALTDLEALDHAGWRTHVARLVLNRDDLKYDFLREVTAKAGVQVTDTRVEIVRKLEPFFTPIIHTALERIRDHAAADGASMILALIPGSGNPELAAADLDRLGPAVKGLGVPTLDVRDTFVGQQIQSIIVEPGDYHPNALGHELIFRHLYTALRADPQAWKDITVPAARQ